MPDDLARPFEPDWTLAELRAMLADLASQLEVSATLAENIAGRIEAGTR